MNLKETIRKVLREETIPPTANELIKSLPEKLKKLFFNQWKAKQNPKWHPEGNTLKHIIVVVKRAYEHYPNDPNMIMAALFHDLGKMDTYKINPKTGQPTAYGHEDVSTKYVEEFKDWIESFDGTDVDEIMYLVKNHMKVKPSTWDAMRDTKKEPIQKHPAFNKLMGFTDNLDGGGTNIRKVVKESFKDGVLREENKKKDLSKFIKGLVDEFLMNNDPDKDYVCSYELFSPTFHGVPKYKIIVHFISGPGGKNWPRTQAVNVTEEAILNEIQDYILSYIGEYVTMYSKTVSDCE